MAETILVPVRNRDQVAEIESIVGRSLSVVNGFVELSADESDDVAFVFAMGETR